MIKALTINEHILGKNHPNLCRNYNNLGLLYSRQGESQMAIDYYEKSLSFAIKQLGEEHPEVGAIYNNPGIVYQNLGDDLEANRYGQLAYDIYSRTEETSYDAIVVKNNFNL